jgi:hypothetical protein
MDMSYTLLQLENVDRRVIQVSFEPLVGLTQYQTLRKIQQNSLDQRNILEAMDNWCVQNECGWRESNILFGFENDQALTLFLLRWQ